MAKVEVIIEGYTNADKKAKGEDEETCSTSVVVEDNDFVIISDPGVLKDQQVLVDALNQKGLRIKDITHVFITHSHIDHYRNVGMFPRAKLIEYWGLWDGAKCDRYDQQFSKNIKILKTPGHNYDGLTMLVETEKGVIAIAGDLWWKENYPEIDPYASDMEKLNQSRKKVLGLADYIIPGHGKMFKANK